MYRPNAPTTAVYNASVSTNATIYWTLSNLDAFMFPWKVLDGPLVPWTGSNLAPTLAVNLTMAPGAAVCGTSAGMATMACPVKITPGSLPSCTSPNIPSNACGSGGYLLDATAIPGIFTFYNVPFFVGEVINNGEFARNFTPSDDQRIFIEYAIIQTSAKSINDAITNAATAMSSAGSVSTGVASTIGRQTVNSIITQLSIQDAQKLVPDFQYNRPGFHNLPIQPTAAELTNSGGYNAWLARGGFPISEQVAAGHVAIGGGYISVNTVMPCDCGNGYIGKIMGLLTDTGVQVGGNSDNSWWQARAAVSTDGSSIYLQLNHEDPTWWQRVGDALLGAFDFIAKLACGAGPIMALIPGAQIAGVVLALTCLADVLLVPKAAQPTTLPINSQIFQTGAQVYDATTQPPPYLPSPLPYPSLPFPPPTTPVAATSINSLVLLGLGVFGAAVIVIIRKNRQRK